MGNKKPRGYWNNKDNILKEIKLLHSNGIELNPRNIDRYNSSLRTVARKIFGSWENAVTLAGFNYENIKKTKIRNREDVINDLLCRYKDGKEINQTALMKDDCALFSASVSQFGTFANAIEACGLDYYSIKKIESWSREIVLEELKSILDRGDSLNLSSIQKENPLLYGAIYRHFKHFNLAIEELGIDYNSVKKVKHWKDEEVIEALQFRSKNNLPLCSSALERDEPSLYTACINKFNSFKNAIGLAGLDYNKIREDQGWINYYGYLFEDIVGDIFNDLQINFTKKYNNEYQPDFVLSNDRWVDAKLSQWSIYKSKTIEKYEPMCKILTIVFLRGDIEMDMMITDKTRLINIYKYVKQLPNGKRQFYIEKLEDVLKRIKKDSGQS